MKFEVVIWQSGFADDGGAQDLFYNKIYPAIQRVHEGCPVILLQRRQ